jgi:hypothetical protein
MFKRSRWFAAAPAIRTLKVIFAVICATASISLRAGPLLTSGVTSIGTNAYPYTNKPAAGSQINPGRPLAAGLVSAVAINEGAGTNFYDGATQLSYPALLLSGSPAGAQPPTWFAPVLSTNYPWAGPAISNNGATAQSIVSPLQETNLIHDVTNGYSYAELMQPLDTTTFGRMMDATGAAVITTYLNIPGRNGLVSTTWRDSTDTAINPTAPFTAGKWILVLFTVQDGMGVMYINGAQAASSTNVILSDSLLGQVGPVHYNTTGGSMPGTQMCNANFSSWWVWNNRVLTPQEAAQFYASPWSMFYSGAQKGFVKGTKVILTNTASASNVWFYSHVAQGNLRLAIYDDHLNLLWQSSAVSNAVVNGWIAIPISSGAPSTVTLSPDAYWLAWQVDTTYDVPSYSAGTNGAGFSLAQSFGAFPGAITNAQTTSETWSIYLDYSASSAAPTFTGASFQAGGALQLQLQGNTNISFGLQVSTDLVSWLPLNAPAFVSNGLWFYLDTNTHAFPGRFYRAESP